MRLSTNPVVIELRSASFGYADQVVLRQADLAINRGDVVALLGPNGSGKSTLVRGLLGLNDHLAGQVELFGQPLARFHQRSRIGYVPQRHSLSASVRATVAEIVQIGRLPHRRWWSLPSRKDDPIVADALELVGLADRAGEDVSTLSGGQQRRVLIARALAAQPDVLVMDEPTAGVDAANQQVLAGVLRRLADRGTTMLIVTHELDALADVVTRVACTSNGHLDFDGTMVDYLGGHRCAAEPPSHHHDAELLDLMTEGANAPGAGPLDATAKDSHG